MNIWSMAVAGGDLKQHTHHRGYDVQSPSLSDGRIAYQLGRRHPPARHRGPARTSAVPITLVSDFDQLREKWVTNPMDWVTSAHLSPNGDRVVLTARGQVFVAPAQQGRIVEATRNSKVRYRNARFLPDGKSVLALSDESGEVEFWRVPANGVGAATQLTTDGKVLRWDGLPSPDGKYIAHHDKDQPPLDLRRRRRRPRPRWPRRSTADFDDVQWSPDSRWLAFDVPGPNQLSRISICEAATGRVTPVTSDRYDSQSPAWSPDGKWLYFLSDRNFESVVGSPWGSRQPEPFFDKQTKIYGLALKQGERSPFAAGRRTARSAESRQGREEAETKDDQERARVRPRRRPGRTGVPPAPSQASPAPSRPSRRLPQTTRTRPRTRSSREGGHRPRRHRIAPHRGPRAGRQLLRPLGRRQAALLRVP